VQRRTSTRVKIRQNEKTAYLGATSFGRPKKSKAFKDTQHTFAALVRARSVGYMRLQQRGCRKYLQSHIYIQCQTLCNKALVNLHERKQVPGRRRHAHSRLFGCDEIRALHPFPPPGGRHPCMCIIPLCAHYAPRNSTVHLILLSGMNARLITASHHSNESLCCCCVNRICFCCVIAPLYVLLL
jgi:hypothetical protein